MRIFKNKWFDRFADKEGITDDELKDVVDLLEKDRPDADLGAGVYKMRVARFGAGKSGGYRAIVFFSSGKRTFFVYGFAKSGMDDINERQLRDFKKAAKIAFKYTEPELDDRVKTGFYLEI